MIRTAYWIAAVRARESARSDRLFDDPWAAALAGDTGAAMMAASERAGGSENSFLPVRTRWFDDAINAAVASGIGQVVALGAGMDTRPHRLHMPSEVAWFEIDQPEIFPAKQAVLGSVNPSCQRIVVAADLRADWPAALTAAGFDSETPTAWIAEGLLFYLAPEAVEALLHTAARLSAPGSLLHFDVMSASGLAVAPGMDAYRRHREAALEPPPYGHDDPGLLLTTTGWQPTRLTWAGAPDANYGRLHRVTTTSGRTSARAHLVVGRC